MKRFMVWAIALVFLFCTSAIAAERGTTDPAVADAKVAPKAEKKELSAEQKAAADKKAADKKAKAEKKAADKKAKAEKKAADKKAKADKKAAEKKADEKKDPMPASGK